MSRNPKKYLFDIVDSIELIQRYLSPINSWQELADDLEKIDAVERRMGIIGEALWKLQKIEIRLTQSDWAINFRNTLIHQYDVTGVDTIWLHAQNDLPALAKEAQTLLDTDLDEPTN